MSQLVTRFTLFLSLLPLFLPGRLSLALNLSIYRTLPLCSGVLATLKGTVSFGSGHEAVMKFTTDNETNGLGFMITIMQQDCPHIGQCGEAIFSGHRFVLTSPGYPLPYGNGKKCKYYVTKQNPRVCKLKMILRSFDVEYQAHCDSDFFELDDGNRLCGFQESGQIGKFDWKTIFAFLLLAPSHFS